MATLSELLNTQPCFIVTDYFPPIKIIYIDTTSLPRISPLNLRRSFLYGGRHRDICSKMRNPEIFEVAFFTPSRDMMYSWANGRVVVSSSLFLGLPRAFDAGCGEGDFKTLLTFA